MIFPYEEDAEEPIVTVSAETVLARWGARSLALADIVPLGATETERAMTPSMLKYLVGRAMERELVLEEAAAAKVELSADRLRELEQYRAQLETQRSDPGVLERPYELTDERIAFELRDAQALLLQQQLLERAKLPSPHVSEEQVRAYYEQNRSRYGSLPDDPAARQQKWLEIDYAIRQELAPKVLEEYERARQEYLDKLKAKARVTYSLPTPAP